MSATATSVIPREQYGVESLRIPLHRVYFQKVMERRINRLLTIEIFSRGILSGRLSQPRYVWNQNEGTFRCETWQKEILIIHVNLFPTLVEFKFDAPIGREKDRDARNLLIDLREEIKMLTSEWEAAL